MCRAVLAETGGTYVREGATLTFPLTHLGT